MTFFLSFYVGISVDDDFACHGAHAHSSPPFKSLRNGTWATVRFLKATTLFCSNVFSYRVYLLSLLAFWPEMYASCAREIESENDDSTFIHNYDGQQTIARRQQRQCDY